MPHPVSKVNRISGKKHIGNRTNADLSVIHEEKVYQQQKKTEYHIKSPVAWQSGDMADPHKTKIERIHAEVGELEQTDAISTENIAKQHKKNSTRV